MKRFVMSWSSWVGGVESHYQFLEHAERRRAAGQALNQEEEDMLRMSQQVVAKYHRSGHRKRAAANSFTVPVKRGPKKNYPPADGLRSPKQAESPVFIEEKEGRTK